MWLFGLACGGAVAGHPGTGPLVVAAAVRGDSSELRPQPCRACTESYCVLTWQERWKRQGCQVLKSWAVFLMLGSLESLVYTRPQHITVFLPQLLYFGAEEKKVSGSGSKA